MVRKLLVISAVLLLACVLVPVTPAQDTLSGQIILTVKDAPLSLPNGGVLTPGKYSMQFVDSEDSIVSISREDGTAVGMYLVRPTILPEAPSKTDIMVGWLPDGSPAIRGFAYPGQLNGFRFDYSGAEPALLANNPAPGSVTVSQANTGNANETPESSQSVSATNPPAAEPNPSEAMSGGQESETIIAAAPELPEKASELPQTASPLPLLGLLGIASVVAGIVGRRRAALRNSS